MRKRIINQAPHDVSPIDSNWLDLQRLAQVEVTSEEAANPIEAALIPNVGSGWRAEQAGEQSVRLLFDELQPVRRIQLLFHEDQQARTQEFVLRWLADAGQSYREIVRQQFNFSPPGTTREVEDYTVDLAGVKSLELKHAVHLNGLRCLQCWPGRPIMAVALVVVDTEVTRLSGAVVSTWNGARDGARLH